MSESVKNHTGPVGIEPTTTWLKARCSTELSYGPQAVMV